MLCNVNLKLSSVIDRDPFYKHYSINWNKYIQYTVWDEITYPFPNFNGAALSHFGAM